MQNIFDVVILMYHLIEYSNNYWKTSASLWQYKRDELADAKVNSEFTIIYNKFKYKIIATEKIHDNSDIKTDKIAFQVKYLNNVWRILRMFLIVKKSCSNMSCFFSQ